MTPEKPVTGLDSVAPALEEGPLSSSLDDPRVLTAVEEYLAALESGRRPDRHEFIAHHPELADVLSNCLDGLDFLLRTASTLGASADAPSAAPNPSLPDQLGTPLGDFRIQRELGRGGMGIVYEADQLSLGRRVALKVLPFAAALDPRQLQRFKNEAQAAAHLHHSNIVPVFGVGCERGVHYYAMQLIEGKTLAAVIGEQSQLSESSSGRDGEIVSRRPPGPGGFDQPTVVFVGQEPGPPADPATTTTLARACWTTEQAQRPGIFRTAAQLAIQAAEALEHAHQFGIIHRDIKPANLMVDERNHLWITDFGLARCQSEVGLTMTGDVLGTLRYMSPEQALAKRGLVDHRTDLYSLGATLYELLTLKPVFPGSDRQELLRQIAFDEPRPLRSHGRGIPRELETIVLKALAKHPEDRYGTAQDMADDVRRFLDDRPILARRPSLPERAVKWSRRHKPVLVSAVLVLVLAVIGLATSTILISQEQARTEAALQDAILAGSQEREARLAEAEALRKETEARLRESEARRKETEIRQRAEENFRQARQVVDYLSQVAAEDLKDMPELHDLRKKILETALKYYDALIEQSRNDEALREELVTSSVQVADILNKLGNKRQAFAMYEVARLSAEHDALKKPSPAAYQRLYWIWDRQGSARLGLVNSSSEVQQELRLSATQRRQITELTARRTRLLAEAVQPNPDRSDKLASLVDDEEKELDSILTAEQAKRLSELVVQQRGAEAFRDPKVIATLRLTSEQDMQINSILAATRPPLTPRMRVTGALTVPIEQGRERKPTEQLLDVLTSEQKATWRELVGEPSPLVLLQLKESVAVRPALPGAGLEPAGQTLVAQLGLGRGQGLLVTTVQPNSAAAMAGLQVHDILWELDGKPVPGTWPEFQRTFATLKPDAPVDAVVIRKGQKTTLTGLALPKANDPIPVPR